MSIGVDLAGKQSFSQNANTKGALPKPNCSSTADFIPNVTKFHLGTYHVYALFHSRISWFYLISELRKQHLNTALPSIPSKSLLLVLLIR